MSSLSVTLKIEGEALKILTEVTELERYLLTRTDVSIVLQLDGSLNVEESRTIPTLPSIYSMKVMDLAAEARDNQATLAERMGRCLLRAQIRTVGELVKLTEDDLLDVINFGRKSLNLVIELLDNHDLKLASK